MTEIKAKHVFTLLILYWFAWLYTELSEKWERDEFYVEVNDFMTAGDRFTKEDGEELKKRVAELEKANE